MIYIEGNGKQLNNDFNVSATFIFLFTCCFNDVSFYFSSSFDNEDNNTVNET
jgi:hypothetical protein